MTFLLKTDPVRGLEWQRLFAEKAPGVTFKLWPDTGDPGGVKYLAVWSPPADISKLFPNLEILFSTGAGVDQFDFSVLPASLPVVRLIEPGTVNGMVEYVTMAVLAMHRDLFTYQAQQRQGNWREIRVWPASTRRIGVLGMGTLGEAVARKLSGFGFEVGGWSRSRHTIENVTCFSGDSEMPEFLGRTDILVCLLPLTRETQGILNADLYSKLPRGAKLINVGRGKHLNHDDLRDALNEGQIAAAILDVSDPEPLPQNHWLWRDERVLITPHIASMTQPQTAVEFVIDNLRRHERGEPLIGLINRTRGY
jgi:glyoxylate/hydroxypyruvate reductase A